MISQSPKITSDVVLGTIGGLIGLFLGASLLTFGEIIEISVNVAKVVFEVYIFNHTDIININYLKRNNKIMENRTNLKVRPSMLARLRRKGILSILTDR